MTLTCQCCNITQDFENENEAFQAGWDFPPTFPYAGCDLCPGVFIMMGKTHEHETTHQKWAKEGRPKT